MSETRKRLNVLVAEDDPVTRRLLEASLTNWNYEVLSTGDGEEAQKMLHSAKFDVCIFDWEMPNVSGIDLCKWVGSAQLVPKPYVILLTSHSEIGAVSEIYKAGADDYVGKPFDREHLRRRLEIGTRRCG